LTRGNEMEAKRHLHQCMIHISMHMAICGAHGGAQGSGVKCGVRSSVRCIVCFFYVALRCRTFRVRRCAAVCPSVRPYVARCLYRVGSLRDVRSAAIWRPRTPLLCCARCRRCTFDLLCVGVLCRIVFKGDLRTHLLHCAWSVVPMGILCRIVIGREPQTPYLFRARPRRCA